MNKVGDDPMYVLIRGQVGRYVNGLEMTLLAVLKQTESVCERETDEKKVTFTVRV